MKYGAKLIIGSLIVVIIAIAAIAGHQLMQTVPGGEDTQMPEVDFYVRLGDTGEELHANNEAAIKDDGVVGVIFHEAGGTITDEWLKVHLTTTHDQTVTLPLAKRIFIPEDAGRGRPIHEVKIVLNMPKAPENDSDPDAVITYQRQVFELYNKLNRALRSAGWAKYISPGTARAVGIDTYQFKDWYRATPLTQDDYRMLQPDPYYGLSFEDWRHLAGTSVDWEWYAPGALIKVTYRQLYRLRSGHLMGAIIELLIRDDFDYFSGFDHTGDEPRSAEQGREFYKSRLPLYFRTRRVREEKLEQLGIPLDQSYEDLPIGGIPVSEYD